MKKGDGKEILKKRADLLSLEKKKLKNKELAVTIGSSLCAPKGSCDKNSPIALVTSTIKL